MTSHAPAGREDFYGHPSAEHLEYWLDTQVIAGKLSPAQAQLMLPSYEPPHDEHAPLLVTGDPALGCSNGHGADRRVR